MVKGLIYLNADLASSIALRYVCQLANMKGILVDSIHVEETTQDMHTPGTGWVRKTWEKGVKENAGHKILQLVNAEKRSCIHLSDPVIMVGDHETEVKSTLGLKTYDFFVEGILQSFSPLKFKEKIFSKLYKNISCPVLLVKNFIEIKKVAIIIDQKENTRSLTDPLKKIIKDTGLVCDLVKCELNSESVVKVEEMTGGQDDNLDYSKTFIKKEAEIDIMKNIKIQGDPVAAADFLHDYGLVVIPVDKAMSKHSHVIDMMNQVASALLICWV